MKSQVAVWAMDVLTILFLDYDSIGKGYYSKQSEGKYSLNCVYPLHEHISGIKKSGIWALALFACCGII